MNKILTCGMTVLGCLGVLGCAVQAQPDSSAVNVDAKKVAQLLKENPSIIVLDIRTPEEFKAGHIAGAKNIDYHAADFARKLEALDKTKSYVVHCRSGRRSGSAMKIFSKLGFSSIYHLKGGINDWVKAKQPLEKES